MKELDQCYVTPCVESYELENENFIAASSPKTVGFGNGESGTGGWTISKGGYGDTQDYEEELL